MKVTVVVPTRNAGRTLGSCLRSIRAQTHPDVELVVVDNASTDATAEIAAAHAHRVEHRGPERSAQRNHGWRTGTGEVVIFIDADMVLEPGVVAEAVRVLDDNPEVGGLVIPEHAFGDGFFARCRVLEKEAYLGDPAVEAARIFRRAAVERVGGYDEALTSFEDWDLADRIAAEGYGIGRIEARVWHDEGRVRLRTCFAKKRYYGRWMALYRAHPAPVRKLGRGRFVMRLLGTGRPVAVAGLLLLKSVEALGMLAGSARLSFLVPAYVLPLLVTEAAVLSWFGREGTLAGGDVAPYVRDNLGGELTSLWGHQLTGAGSTSFSITQALDVLLLSAFPARAAQCVLFALCVGAACLGGAFLAAVWTRRAWAVGLAGLAVAFNAHVLSTLPDVRFALAAGLIGLYAGVLLRVANGRPGRPVVLALLTLPCSYLAVNPALLAVTAAAVLAVVPVAALLTGRRGMTRCLRLLAGCAPWALLFNLWWITPFAVTIFSGEGPGLVAQTAAGSWAWAHARSSVANVLTLEAGWTWLPFLRETQGGPLALLGPALPLVALCGLVAAWLAGGPLRRLAVASAVAVAVLALLGKGSHPPLPEVNLWLQNHVPGMWLLRDPVNKVSGPLVLVYAVLAAIALDKAAGLRPVVRPVLRVVLPAAMVAALLHPLPMWAASATSGVVVPTGWSELAGAVNRAPEAGKALLLPLGSYYQVGTSWGYDGVDAVPGQLLRRPTLQLLPGGYFGSPAEPLLRAVESSLSSGAGPAALAGLRALGVSHVIVRADLPDERQDAARLRETLDALPEVEGAGDYGVARLYRLAVPGGPVQVYGGIADGGSAAVPLAASAGSVVAKGGAVLASRAVRLVAPATSVPVAVEAGQYVTSLASSAYRVTADRSGLSAVPTASVEVDGRPAERTPGRVMRPQEPSGAVFDGQVARPLTARPQTFTHPGDRPLSLLGRPRQATLSAWGPLADCDRHDSGDAARTGLALTRRPGPVLRLTARRHSACTSARLTPAPLLGVTTGASARLTPAPAHTVGAGASARLTPAPVDRGVYRLRLKHRTLAGRPARVCLWQRGPGRCAGLPPLPTGPGWRVTEAVVRLDPATTGLELYLYADGDDGRPTVTEYARVRLDALPELATLAPGELLPAASTPLSAGRHQLVVRDDSRPVRVLGRFAPTAECTGEVTTAARLRAREGTATVRLRADEAAATVRLSAPEEVATVPLRAPEEVATVRLSAGRRGACAEAAVSGPVASAYRLTLDYRTLSGRAARICLWQEGPGRCAALPALAGVGRWRRLSTVVAPEPGTEALRLLLYADGQSVTEYRDVALSRVVPVTVTPQSRDEPPHLTYEAADAGGYDVRVGGAKGEFVLVLAESYAPGWRLEGLPAGWRARHFTANGYANGWLVSGGGSGEAALSIVYAPERLAAGSVAASVAALPLGLLLLMPWRPSWLRVARPSRLRVARPSRLRVARLARLRSWSGPCRWRL